MNNYLVSLFGALFALSLLALPMMATADDTEEPSQTVQQLEEGILGLEQGSASVIESFANDNSATSELVTIEDKTKRLVMFVLGVPLLIFLLATAALGVAMGVYGKQVFVPHMVCAGLSLTLALGHAVVGIVWFYPF